MTQPVLRTHRLLLRPLLESDWHAIHRYASDPSVVQYVPWGPSQPADTIAYVRQAVMNQEKTPRQHYEFAIVSAVDGLLIGNCGLHLNEKDNQEASFGYIFNRGFWGQGFATEAVRALLEFGFRELGLRRMVATCHPQNIASIQVLEKAGLRLEAHFRQHRLLRGQPRDSFLYATLNEEWLEPPRRGVIFDMDGVLVDTEPLYHSFNLEVFKKLGITVADERYTGFVGLSAVKMWQQLKDEYRLDYAVADLVQMEIDAIKSGLINADLAPVEGVLAFIDRLDRAKIPFALASSSAHHIIHIVLSKSGMLDRFKVIVSGQDVENGKPAPDIFILAARKLGLSPEKCLVIEDSGHGVRGAKAAGMHSAGFNNPNSGPQDLSSSDLIVKGFSETETARILTLLESI